MNLMSYFQNYKEMEDKVKKIFGEISDEELKGTYFPLTGMSKDVQDKLIADHFLFKEGDRSVNKTFCELCWRL